MGELKDISSYTYDVGCDILNTLLNFYIPQIKPEAQIIIKGKLGEIDDFSQKNICTIFSNMLKNSVEAINSLPDEAQPIFMLEARRGRDFLAVSIQNSAFLSEDQIVRMKSGNNYSSKDTPTDHGFGISNIERAVKKCGGKFEIAVLDNLFTSTVILPTRGLHLC